MPKTVWGLSEGCSWEQAECITQAPSGYSLWLRATMGQR